MHKRARNVVIVFFAVSFQSTKLLSSYWVSEASPTLGCSIEISCDIYVVGMSYVCRMSN